MAKEQKNSPNDMDTITMWATVSSLGADARYKRPLHITSQPVDVTNGTDVPEVANTRTVIQSFDGAKLLKVIGTTNGNAKNVINTQKIGFLTWIHECFLVTFIYRCRW